MKRNDEKAYDSWLSEQSRWSPDSHSQAYHHNGRGINYLGMIIRLPYPTLIQVDDLITKNYPANYPRTELYHDNFFDVVDRLDRKLAHEVLDLINGIHVYGEIKPGTPNTNNSNNQTAESSSSSCSSSSSSASASAAKFTRTVETSISPDGSFQSTSERPTSVTYTVRNSGDGGPTVVIAGLPPHGHVEPARMAEAMRAASEILAGLHRLVSLVVGR
ncbi:hypothetical protein F4820DRAFT_472083 [Hypoxylon rubiginosum]|uniref:Uncharacterized protein n=1 Tax=Hypoxylon rubiginosum TaxID=110542 RepID=A0ACB9YTQ9_9PEZI|nr:hypothetical protein F4820DRAFT_472083 [Hypoxylon rubiginosum]